MIVSWVEQAVTRMDMRVMNLEYSVAMLTGRLEAVEKQAATEPPEPPPDLEATIRSVRESNEGLRNLLADAKQTERDLDAEIVALQKENHRLTRLAWQAEQDKRAIDTAAKALAEELQSVQEEIEQAREEMDLARRKRDDLARRLEFEMGERDAMRDERDALSVRIANERRALLSLLGVTNEEG